MTHRHAFVPIDGTLFAASYAQPGVLVCLECGEQRLGIDRERLARALGYSPMHWEVRRDDGAFVMTRMFANAEEAAAAIADRYEADDE